jgi:hypothetical protein
MGRPLGCVLAGNSTARQWILGRDAAECVQCVLRTGSCGLALCCIGDTVLVWQLYRLDRCNPYRRWQRLVVRFFEMNITKCVLLTKIKLHVLSMRIAPLGLRCMGEQLWACSVFYRQAVVGLQCILLAGRYM